MAALLVVSVPNARAESEKAEPAAEAEAARPGTADVSFGTDGSFRTNLGGTYDWAYATVIQPDRRILAAGVSNAQGTHDFAVARYTADRDLDPTFGANGVTLIDFGDSYDWAYAMAMQPDGKIVVAGVSDASGSKDFALARVGPNGALDANFGRGGLVTGQWRSLSADIIRSIGIQPDGKIVVAGVTYDDVVTPSPHGDFMVARFLPDGQPDFGFGIGGVMTTDFANKTYDDAYALVLQPDGKLVLGGYTNSGSGPGVLFGADQLALARYTPQGLLDPTFGQGGKLVFDGGSLDERILALAPAKDGSLFAGGYVNGEKRSDLLLARITPDGNLEPGFGTTAKGFSINNLGTHSERVASLALQPDGKIVAGGQTAVANHADFAVFRYDAAGLLDGTFGRGGVASFDFGGREDRVHAVALQPDGKIVAV
ncbi:MAG TPA: hypothetical protein VFS16_19905, partial [Acidimicrobiia bacterium]|nr:hypothetical protein [Acidimicrobiia bacterium]